MQIMLTRSHAASPQLFQVSRWQLGAMLAAVMVLLLLLSGTVYHFVFLQAAREGWPVVSQIVKLVVRDEIAQRDRFMRENLDAMAQRVGEMKARLIRLDAQSERVLGLAGVKAEETKGLRKTEGGGKGGPLVLLEKPDLAELATALDQVEETANLQGDLFTLAQAHLMERRLQALMVPNTLPVDGPVGSGFGFRQDPFTGRAALHTGLDFPADVGTPVRAAAGGMVINTEPHPGYGQLLELDHGSGLVTRYAHLSKILVKNGDLVKRGQQVGQVGNTGRSTGPHLHFEVLIDSAPHNPARFLKAETGADLRR
jgi:murein DD-endopeptidase MepM/ murein hydrolase activator NlpD